MVVSGGLQNKTFNRAGLLAASPLQTDLGALVSAGAGRNVSLPVSVTPGVKHKAGTTGLVSCAFSLLLTVWVLPVTVFCPASSAAVGSLSCSAELHFRANVCSHVLAVAALPSVHSPAQFLQSRVTSQDAWVTDPRKAKPMQCIVVTRRRTCPVVSRMTPAAFAASCEPVA